MKATMALSEFSDFLAEHKPHLAYYLTNNQPAPFRSSFLQISMKLSKIVVL